MTPDAPRPDLDEAEGWFTYWETIGTRFDEGDADERRAAAVLHAEYDRRGATMVELDVALADAQAEMARLRAAVERYEILTPQACPAGEHPEWLIDSEHNHACPWCEVARLRAIEQRARDAAKAGATEHGDGAVAYTALLILGEV